MDEDAMWKDFYVKLKLPDKQDKTEHDVQIQELDGGFFERFGTLLQEHVAKDSEEVEKELETDAEKTEEKLKNEEEEELEKLEQEIPDQGEIISHTKVSVGLNIEELYSEILYEILHIIGSDVTEFNEQGILLDYLREAFKIDEEQHGTLLENVKSKEAPKVLLNVEVVEAKELASMDPNGLSDPFCTLFLTSNPTHRYNTSVKECTLNPAWEEHFSLPAENIHGDVLRVECWDFDPAETIKEKVTKINEVKGMRGIGKLMKEIALTASTGKHDNELIGLTNVPLKSIPASGQTLWCNLEKKTKGKRQGIVKLKFSFSTEKNSHVARQEHRHLLRILLLHELENNKLEGNNHWNGTFSKEAETILRQHLAQSSLTAIDDCFAQWVEFASVHTNQPLNFQIFADLLKKLSQPINNGLLSDEEIKLFWDAAKKLLPSCFSSIKKIRKFTPSEKSTSLHIQAILIILSELSQIQHSENLDLFPSSVYGWIQHSDDSPNSDIRAALNEVIKQSALDWFVQISEHNKPTEDSEEVQLKHQIKLIQLIRSDLKRAIDYEDKYFSKIMLLPYSKILYLIYENKVSEMCEPLVTEICLDLKPIKYDDEYMPLNNEDSSKLLAMGTTLFELYLGLQTLQTLGAGLCPGDIESLPINKYYLWFHRGVAQWLDIAVYKAVQRVKKAIELDQLTPADGSPVKYSSSAIDTFAIFHQIKVFWQQLSWPEIEGSYAFVAKIMDDICRCCVYYADIMSKKVETQKGETQNSYEKKFNVTNEWCFAINNIDYIQQSISPFVKDLGMDDIITALAEYRTPTAAEHCRQTLQRVIDNAIDTIKNKIIDLLQVVAIKMEPLISRFLMEGAELLHQENKSVDSLLQYLDNNLNTLSSQLNNDNFDRIFNIIWEKISYIIFQLVEDSLEKRRPPSFFGNLHEMLKTLIGFFKGDSNIQMIKNNEVLTKIEKVLTVHSMDTRQLIHQYHLDRLSDQQAMSTHTHGILTVRMQFINDLILKVEVMNGRDLQPCDSNGVSDPYVKIHFIPEEKYASLVKPKTKIHKKTLFPLFDEIFTIQLTREQRETKDAMLHFLVKDHDMFGMSSDYMGEAYYAFKDIPSTTMETKIHELSQIHLKLSKPSKFDTPVVKALDHRQGEKLARDFVKKQKAKGDPQSVTNGHTH